MKNIICASFLLVFNVNLFAGNLYVEKGSQGTSCLAIDPCGVIQDAVDLALANDTIHIGPGVYKENVFIQTGDISLQGDSKNNTVIEAAGGREGALGNAGNALDAILEIRAANVTITALSLVHPRGKAKIREAAIFAWKGSPGLQVTHCLIERKRNKRTDEPTVPGSRGIFIFGGFLGFDGPGPHGLIANNEFRGNYQDHVHLPSNGIIVRDNSMIGASRSGISVMDPVSFVGPDNYNSRNNLIKDNVILKSLDDAIHIQGDSTTITGNTIVKNKGYGIYLCGEGIGGGCYFPGELAISENNIIKDNILNKNKQGSVADFGQGNIIQQ